MRRLLVAFTLAVIIPWQLASTVPALAIASLTITPNTVSRGGTVHVQGTGFPANTVATVSVTLNTSSGSTTITRTPSTDASGNFATDLPTTPDTNAGTYTVYATANGISAQGNFQVTNTTIYLAPNPANPGQTVVVSGTGFTPNTPVTATVTVNQPGNTSITITDTESSNSVGGATLHLPLPTNTIPANYTVFVTQGSLTLNAALQVTASKPAITLAPTTVPAGPYTVVTVSGQGYQGYEQVIASYTANLIGGGTLVEQTTGYADAAGNFTFNNLPVPANVAPGQYTVTAKGVLSGRTATATLTVTVTAILTVSPSSALPNTSVTVSGQHYIANTSVTINATFPTNDGSSQPETTHSTTDSNGSFTASLSIPARALPGDVAITAVQTVGALSATATTHLTVLPLVPVIQLQPTTVVPGTSTVVTGRGFAPGPNAPVTINTQVMVNGTAVPISLSADVDSSGGFTAALSIPNSAQGGTATVVVSQSLSGATASAQLTIVAPTATATPTNTPTPLPTATSTSTPPPPPAKHAVKFKYVHVMFAVIRVGQRQHIGVQATVAARIKIAVHILFPSGRHWDRTGRTDSRGHWFANVVIPKNAVGKRTTIALVEVDLYPGKKTLRRFITFQIRR